MLYSLIKDNERHGTSLSSKNLQEAVSRVVEEEEKDSEHNINNITTQTLFQFPITINAQKKYVNVTNERLIAS